MMIKVPCSAMAIIFVVEAKSRERTALAASGQK
jgi:hypothetical protein